jgi:lauroyl/myristoyl acyltransferase
VTSIFDPWVFEENRAIYERLALMPAAEAWTVMNRIRDLELEELEQEDLDLWTSHLEPRVALAAMDGVSTDGTFARDVARWVLTRTMHYSFLITRFVRANGQVQDIDIDFDWTGCKPIDDAIAHGKGAIVLPLHCGPIEAAVAALAVRYPLTIVISHFANVPDSFQLPLGGADANVKVLRAPGPTVMIEAASHVREGRVVMFPPEFTSKAGDSVREFGLLGQNVEAPLGPGRLAKIVKAPVFTAMLDVHDDHRYSMAVTGPTYPRTTEDVEALFREVIAMVGIELQRRPIEWEGWCMFDRMVGKKLPSPVEVFNLMN